MKNGKNFFRRFRHQMSIGKKSKISKKIFFFKKSYFFFLNLHCTCSKRSFEVYNSHVSKDFKFWPIFAYKISFFVTAFSTASMANTTVHKVLFLVSMDCQRFKKLDGSQFWALECLLTASGWLESIRTIMAPTRVITSFQSSCEIGLKTEFACALEMFWN